MIFKKCISSIVVLAIALPAVAGDTKVHKPWPTKTVYSWQDITTIDVVLDVGYYIDIVNQDDIEVSQTSINGQDPFFTYLGCSDSEVVSNFHAQMTGDVVATSAAGGDWSVTFNGLDVLEILPGSTNVTICVLGQNVMIEQLVDLGGEDNVKVAELTIKVAPFGVQVE